MIVSLAFLTNIYLQIRHFDWQIKHLDRWVEWFRQGGTYWLYTDTKDIHRRKGKREVEA